MTPNQGSLLDVPMKVDYPVTGYHHRGASETERQGAAYSKLSSKWKRTALLRALAVRGLTDHEASEAIGIPISSINSTRNSLITNGFVEDSHTKRQGPYGVPNIVWQITDAGREALLEVKS